MNFSAPLADEAHALKCELAGEVLRSFGTLRLQVTGCSMLPSVMPGDTLVVERIFINAAAEGDIVLFSRSRRLFAHRVIAKREAKNAAILTRGDAMPALDPPVAESDLLGRVSFILRNGKCIEPSRTLRFSERAVAALARRSDFAARVVVGMQGLRQSSFAQPSQFQTQ
jgi:hypothetical protein